MNPENLSIGVSQGQLNTAVANIGQFNSVWQAPVYDSPYWKGAPPAQAHPGVIDAFFQKADSVFHESGHLLEQAGSWVARTTAEAVTAVAHLPSDAATMGHDLYFANQYQSQAQQLGQETDILHRQFKAGQITKQEYVTGLNQLTQANLSLGHTLTDLAAKAKSDEGRAVSDLINTGATIVTVATAGLTSPLVGVADKGAVDAGQFLMSRAAADLFNPAEQALQKVAMDKALFNKLPAFIQNSTKASVTDTLLMTGAKLTAPETMRAAAINMAVKYPLAFNWLSGSGKDVANELQSGKYGDAVKTLGFNLGLLFAGGPVGDALAKFTPKVAATVRGAVFGQTSFLDTLSRAIGDGNAEKLYQVIKNNPAAIRAFQALEAVNLKAEGGQVGRAVYRIVDGLKQNGWDLKSATHQDFVKDVMNWHEAQSTLTKTLLKSGMSADEAARYVVGRWTAYDANRVAEVVSTGTLSAPEKASWLKNIKGNASGSQKDMLANWEAFKAKNPFISFANNNNLDRQIKQIIKTSDTADEAATRIKNIAAGIAGEGAGDKIPKALARRLGKLGYSIIAPKNLEAPFVQGEQKLVTRFGQTNDVFEQAAPPLPGFEQLGTLLTKWGLSPDRAPYAVSDLFKAHLQSNLQATSLFKNLSKKYTTEEGNKWADRIYTALSNHARDINKVKFNLTHPPITDLRQMTRQEIQDALKKIKPNLSDAQAKEVQQSLMQSMLDLSWSERGLGPKLLDIVNGKNTILQKYLRVQGAGRFAWNPFFKMKLGYKTEFLTQMETGGKAPTVLGSNTMLKILFPDHYERLDATTKLLEERGLFGSGFTGEAAQETAGQISAAAKGMTKTQQRSIAGMVNVMAKRTGLSTEEFLNKFPQESHDVIEAVLHYDPRSEFLNSSLARTLNMVVFPFRFNVKVATFMAKTLARQSWVTRTAVLNGMFQAHDFLTSEQGMAWYSQNSDVIGLLEYFSPLETISTITKLGGITDHSIGAFGELGGLPVGFIPIMLQAEGLYQASEPYVNPKTGQPGSQWIPLDAKARLATAISSFIGTLFTYPGTTAGLPSKSGTLAQATRALTGAKSSEWQKVPEKDLTPQQQQFAQAVQQLQNSDPAAATSPENPQPAPPVTTTTPTGTATAAPRYNTKTGKPKAKKLKKSEEPVYALPGQSVVGQL